MGRKDELSHAERISNMSVEELAEAIMRTQKQDLSVLWCRDECGCKDLDESFDCTDERQAQCIIAWLNTREAVMRLEEKNGG